MKTELDTEPTVTPAPVTPDPVPAVDPVTPSAPEPPAQPLADPFAEMEEIAKGGLSDANVVRVQAMAFVSIARDLRCLVEHLHPKSAKVAHEAPAADNVPDAAKHQTAHRSGHRH